MLVVAACTPSGAPGDELRDAATSEPDADAIVDVGSDPPADAPSDAPPQPAAGRILYPEGRRHSPLTARIVDRLQGIAATTSREARVFAKIGDSHSASSDFLACFAGGNANLGGHASLAPTIDYFDAGNAAGASPFQRDSVAAVGGTTSRDALEGSPCPLQREIEAIDSRVAVVLFGTNELRYGWSFDDFGASLWALVDETLGSGVVPILSTIPPNGGDPGTDARIPTANRIVRALAQGREVPLVDLHRELVGLPDRGLASDRLHMSVSPAGACTLTSDGLRYGQNVRNLITVEALARVKAGLGGAAADSAAPERAGAGTATSPYRGALPLVDLADTRSGEAAIASYSCGTRTQAGRELVYQLDLAAATTIEATVVDRDAVDVDVHIIGGQLAGGPCLAAGDSSARATVGPGKVFVVVDSPSAAREGEMILVIEQR